MTTTNMQLAMVIAEMVIYVHAMYAYLRIMFARDSGFRLISFRASLGPYANHSASSLNLLMIEIFRIPTIRDADIPSKRMIVAAAEMRSFIQFSFLSAMNAMQKNKLTIAQKSKSPSEPP